MVGQTVSHYRIFASLGVMAWGVTKLRTSNLAPCRAQFLPQELARDTQALERFQPQARAASALNQLAQ